MSRLRVGLLTNPTAASGSAHRTGRQVSHLLSLVGISVVDVSGPTSAVARARAAEVRDTLTALVVVGGDGTVGLGAEIVANTPVRLGVVPAGSGNDLARALGLPIGDPAEAVRLLLSCLSRPVVTMDAISLASADPDVSPRPSIVLGNVSLGFDALVNARANRSRSVGSARYTVAVAQELRSFRELPYWAEIDGGPREEFDASLVTLAGTGLFGGGMRIVPDARPDDGVLELAVVQGLGRARLLRFFPRVFRGTHVGIEGFCVRPVRELVIGLREDQDRRDGLALRAYADGEPRALLPVRARVLPGAVRILAELPGATPIPGAADGGTAPDPREAEPLHRTSPSRFGGGPR